MYVAACAFLLESTMHAYPTTHQEMLPYDHPSSPFSITFTHLSPTSTADDHCNDDVTSLGHGSSDAQGEKDVTKEGLLAAAASRDYQRCYKALKVLESYWAGTRYIVTVLDQKAKGSLDPLLYTAEDLRGAPETRNPEAVFGAPGWGEVPGFAQNSTSSSKIEQTYSLDRLKSAVTPLGEGGKPSKIDSSHGGLDCSLL